MKFSLKIINSKELQILKITISEKLWNEYVLEIRIVLNRGDKINPNLFIYFFLKSFNLWCSLLMITLYHQTKTSIGF